MMNFVKALLAIFLFAYSQLSYADCSAYKGQATLNEVGMDQEKFIEIKLLDTSIPQADYQSWSVRICKDEGQGSCSTIILTGITPSNSAYLVVPITKHFPKKHKIFDVILQDGSGNTIDYLSVDYAHQQDSNCSLDNDWQVPVSDTHNYHRSPDGVGDWDNSGDHADSDFTQGESNGGTASVSSILELRFDEDSWDGSSGEVKDNSGNGLHGQSFNDADTDDDTVALIGDPGTCGYGEFDGSSTYVAVPDNNLLDISNNLTLSAWVYPTKEKQQVIISKARRSSGINNYQLSLGSAKRLLFQYNSGGVAKAAEPDANSLTVPLNEWSHVAVTYTDGKQEFYINGIKVGESNNTGTLDMNDADLDIGAERLYDGLDFGAFYFEGNIDEVRVYNGALTSDQVFVVANERHPCGTQILAPILEYRFDECSFTGETGDVFDQTENYHGTSNGTIEPYDDAIINTGLDLSDINSENWVRVPKESVDGLDDFSITTWFKVDAQGTTNKQYIFYALGKDDKGKDKGEEIDIHLHLENNKDDKVHVHVANKGTNFEVDKQFDNGSWYHLVLTRSGSEICLYINGEEEDCSDDASADTINLVEDNSVVIGQKQEKLGDDFKANESFEGQLEEFKIFNITLTKDEVENIYDNEEDGKNYDGSTRAAQSCNVVPFFQIEHDGSGITCAPEPILIKACDNGDCSNVDTSVDTNVTLTVNGINQTIVISAGVSSNAEFVYTDETTPAVLSLSASSNFQCLNTITGTGSCDVIFSNAGFRFLYGDTNSTSLPNQTSGTVFDETLKIQAVKDEEGVCKGIFEGNTDISLSQENVTPDNTNPGLNFQINGNVNIAKYPALTKDITLTFDADSIATIPTPRYLDAGQIRLHAHYDVDDITLLGSSNTFWVSPAKLVITAKSGATPLNGNTPDHVNKHKAGEYFDFTVSAYNSLGVVTPNYSPEQIQLKLERTGPLLPTSVDGKFNYAAQSSLTTSTSPGFEKVTLSNFSSGVSSYSEARYSEVGLLNLDIQDVNYGFLNNIIDGDSINMGRFYPDHFAQTVVEQGSLDGICNQNTTFAYIGQKLISDDAIGAISYFVNPIIELTAKNKDGDTTQNYTEGDYMKLIAAANFIVAPTTDSVITGKDTNLLPLTANIEAGKVDHKGLVVGPNFGIALEKGVLHYELSDDDNFFYIRDENSEINAPQDKNDINFVIDQVNFVDSDGVGINNGVGNAPVDITETLGINLRFGRGYLENSFGPETSDLPQPFFVQYLDTNGKYVVNDQDGCTVFNVTKMAHSSGTLDESKTSVKDINEPAEDGLLVAGETRDMLLAAPGAGNVGTINVEYEVYDWLTYDWDWNGVDAKDFDENPTAVATFGLFRGNDRIIYWREVSR
jgi:MSHA biogenesis protein MshQ